MTSRNDDQMTARVRTVEEHIRRENEHDLKGVLDTFGESARYDEEPWDDHYLGRDQVRAYYQRLFQAAADMQVEIKQRHVADEAVILEVILTGTHTGAWRGLPATGRKVRLPLCAIYTFDEHNKLAGERIYYDRATVLRQLGVLHEPESVAGRLSTLVGHPITMARAIGRKLHGSGSRA